MNIKRILIIGGIITFIGIIIAVIIVASSKKAITPPPINPQQDICKKTCINGDCNTFGLCVCKPGYKGGNCDTLSPKDLCETVNCGPHGNCTDGLCVCIDGYTGTKCSSAPDACIGVDCGTHGSCANGQCVCTKGWSGNKCQTQVQKEVFIILPKNSAGYPLDTDIIEDALASLDKTNNTRLATADEITTYDGAAGGVSFSATTILGDAKDGWVQGPIWVDKNGAINPALILVSPEINGIQKRQVVIDEYGMVADTKDEHGNLRYKQLGGIAVFGLKPAKNSDIANKFIILPHTSTKWSSFNDPYLTQPDLDQIKSNCLDAADQWSSKDTTSFGLMSNTSNMPDELKNQLATCPKSCGKFCQYFPDKAYKYKPYSGWAIASASECSTSDADYYDCNKKTTCLNNCSNKGTCDPVTNLCTCNPGSYGDDCSKKYCPNDGNCLNGGICDTANGFCTCPQSVSGENCQFIECSVENCSGQGFTTCDRSTGVNPPCYCSSDFFGNTCEYKSVQADGGLILQYTNIGLSNQFWNFPNINTRFWQVPENLTPQVDGEHFANGMPGINLTHGKYFGAEDIVFDVHNFTVFAVFKGTFWMDFISPLAYWGNSPGREHSYEPNGLFGHIPDKDPNHNQVGFYIWSSPGVNAFSAARSAWYLDFNAVRSDWMKASFPTDKEVLMTFRRQGNLIQVYKNKQLVYGYADDQAPFEPSSQRGLLQINSRWGNWQDVGWNCLLGQLELCKSLSDNQVEGNQELLMTKFGITD